MGKMNNNKKYQKKSIGEIYELSDGSEGLVVDGGNKYDRCTISYNNNKNEKEVYISALKKGEVKNEYCPNVYGVGFIGVGKYPSQINGKASKGYKAWVQILGRVYSPTFHRKHPSYKGVKICNEWHNFQNFAKWYEDNYKKFDDCRTEIDKDLLSEVTKVYSPSTCVFIPQKLNGFLTNKQLHNTSGFIGVSWHKTSKKYQARIQNFETGTEIYLGLFDTPEEASKAYITARAKQVKIVKRYCINVWNITDERILDNIK